MKKKLMYATLCFICCSCSTRRIARIDPYFDDHHVLVWGRVIPVVDGSETYSCSAELEGGWVPLDKNGIFVAKVFENKTTVKAVRCGDKVVALPTNYASFHQGGGPRAIYLGSLMVKFGSHAKYWNERLAQYDDRVGYYDYVPTNLDYFAVQDHYYKDRLYMNKTWELPGILHASRAILQTPGIDQSTNRQISSLHNNPPPALANSASNKAEIQKASAQYYDYYNGYSYDNNVSSYSDYYYDVNNADQ